MHCENGVKFRLPAAILFSPCHNMTFYSGKASSFQVYFSRKINCYTGQKSFDTMLSGVLTTMLNTTKDKCC